MTANVVAASLRSARETKQGRNSRLCSRILHCFAPRGYTSVRGATFQTASAAACTTRPKGRRLDAVKVTRHKLISHRAISVPGHVGQGGYSCGGVLSSLGQRVRWEGLGRTLMN